MSHLRQTARDVAFEVTDRLETAIASDKYDLIVVNYANPDMVGHTAIKAQRKRPCG